jgi:hypothetical protein
LLATPSVEALGVDRNAVSIYQTRLQSTSSWWMSAAIMGPSGRAELGPSIPSPHFGPEEHRTVNAFVVESTTALARANALLRRHGAPEVADPPSTGRMLAFGRGEPAQRCPPRRHRPTSCRVVPTVDAASPPRAPQGGASRHLLRARAGPRRRFRSGASRCGSGGCWTGTGGRAGHRPHRRTGLRRKAPSLRDSREASHRAPR